MTRTDTPPPPQVPDRSWPLLLKILASSFLAAACGAVTVFFWGKGLSPARPNAVDRFAQVENIRLPVGGRTEADLKSFVVRLKGSSDDFARIAVNNRIVLTEFPAPLKFITWSAKEKTDEYVTRFTVNRSNPISSETDLRRWLRKGTNWIMIELENSRWGACSMAAELLVNGTQLEGSPYFLPRREQIDDKLSNEQLRKRFRQLAEKTNGRNEFGIIPENDALCARLVLAFRLD